jgi:hypothetical protein
MDLGSGGDGRDGRGYFEPSPRKCQVYVVWVAVWFLNFCHFMA